VGALIGAVNGLAIVFLRLPPIVATLAMNVILEGLVLVYTGGTPRGFSPPAISSIMTGSVLGTIVPSALVLLVVLWLLGSFLLTGTTLGRSIYAVGDNGRVAFLSGINVPFVLCAVYAISGCAAALGGILLTGYSGQSALAMGDPYLLPSIAAVILGGASVLGGRGIYSGTVAGALFLSAMQALLQSFNVSSAFRTIIFGVVIVVSASILQLSRLQDTRAGRAFGDLLIKTFHRQREYVVSRWWKRI
jgi:ribose transport system permease protein